MNWRERIMQSAAGAGAGSLVTVLYVAARENGVSAGDWLQFAGVFLGVIATMLGTLWVQDSSARSKRRLDSEAFLQCLNKADDALHHLITKRGDEWRYAATADALLQKAFVLRESINRHSFDLDVATSALSAAWKVCGGDVYLWANNVDEPGSEAGSRLRITARHIQQQVREAMVAFNHATRREIG
jgi:hypothetical protein